MKKIILFFVFALLAVPAVAQTHTSRYFDAPYKFTSNPWSLNANTAAGTDNNAMCLSGGGGTCGDIARGASVTYNGDEVGLGYTSSLIYEAKNSIFQTDNGTLSWILGASNDLVQNGITGGDLIFSRVNAGIKAATNDLNLHLSAGTAMEGSTGAWIRVQGIDVGGPALGGGIALNAVGPNGNIMFSTQSPNRGFDFRMDGDTVWSMETGGHLIQDATDGGSIIINRDVTGIRTATNDISLYFNASDTYAGANGGFIYATGIDFGGVGLGGGVNVGARGDVGSIILSNDVVGVAPGVGTAFWHSGDLQWTVRSDGSIFQDATNGGDIIFEKAGTGLLSEANGVLRAPYAVQASLGGCTVGDLKVCTDCAADCATGGGTGRVCGCAALNTWK